MYLQLNEILFPKSFFKICIMIMIYTCELLYCIDTTEMWKSMVLVDYKICAWYLELEKET